MAITFSELYFFGHEQAGMVLLRPLPQLTHNNAFVDQIAKDDQPIVKEKYESRNFVES